ncbi:MAG TPA: SxtJ family membrane protein [Isosphaeraceae bacterium]|nr:SxtJ family membrane protein [Isosphaeraceae bacterium]
MRWSDIPFDPPRKTLRQFAALWLAFFGGMALWQALVRERAGLASILAVLALTIGPLGLARPEWMRRIYVGWMILAFPIGWTVSQIMLAVMFFGLFTPIGLVFRLLGRDPLHRTRRPELESYWAPKPAPTDLRRYFKQF